MPPTTEKPSLDSDTLVAAAEELAEETESLVERALELFALSAVEVAKLAAIILASLKGIDLDAPFNPAETQQASVKFEMKQCEAPADNMVEEVDELPDALAFTPPSDYHGVMPENAEEEKIFESYFSSFTCEELEAETEEILEFMKNPHSQEMLRSDQRMYRMARDVLDYKRSRGIC